MRIALLALSLTLFGCATAPTRLRRATPAGAACLAAP